MSGYGALASYRDIGIHGDVEAASPHRLITLMMDGALDRIAQAQGALQRGDVVGKGEATSKAIGLIEGLRASLDHSVNAPVSANLEALYEYMGRRLLEANIRSDAAIYTEITNLLRGIRDAWCAIPAEAQGERTDRT